MKLNHLIFCTAIVLSATASAWADFKVKKVDDSVVDPQALTIDGKYGKGINGLSFQQSAVITHGDYQYIGYYDGARRVCIGRRKLPSGSWEVIRFEDYNFKSNDAHNTISIGICPKDGTIHIAFDHHAHPLHYRVSKAGVATKPETVTWSVSLFGPIHSDLEKKKPINITYPRFLQTPDGGLQFLYRRGVSGRGDNMLVDYDPDTGTWKNTRAIDSGDGNFSAPGKSDTTRYGYPNGYEYGPWDRLHVTWVWREDARGSNHDICYAYSDDRGNTWHNNAGQKLTAPPSIASPGITVVPISLDQGMINNQAQAVDSAGRIHTVMSHCTDESLQSANSAGKKSKWGPSEARRYHHYWRDDAGKWQHVELPGATGNRPKLFFDEKDNAYLIFGRNGLVIMAATAASQWKDWHEIHKENCPFLNEMLGDLVRWKKSGVLSVMVQESPQQPHESTRLRILDFTFIRE